MLYDIVKETMYATKKCQYISFFICSREYIFVRIRLVTYFSMKKACQLKCCVQDIEAGTLPVHGVPPLIQDTEEDFRKDFSHALDYFTLPL